MEPPPTEYVHSVVKEDETRINVETKQQCTFGCLKISQIKLKFQICHSSLSNREVSLQIFTKI